MNLTCFPKILVKFQIILFLLFVFLIAGCNAERVSISSSGVQGISSSGGSSLSGDGRYVVFSSNSAFVAQDTNGISDIYIRDKLNSTTELVSFNRTNSSSGNGLSKEPVISANGRYVAFMSYATDLVQSGNTLNYNVYLRDLQTNITTLVSEISTGNFPGGFTGNSGPSISEDGRFIAFTNEGLGSPSAHVYVHDTQTNITTLVSANRFDGGLSNGDSGSSSVSGDGRYIAFMSTSTDLSEDVTGGRLDIFVRDMVSATTKVVSGPPNNGFNSEPAISLNGRFVVFSSNAIATSIVGYTYDFNGTSDVFIRDLQNETTELVSTSWQTLSSQSIAGNNSSTYPAVSADGRYVVYRSTATDLITDSTLTNSGVYNIYIRDRSTNNTTLESIGFTANASGDISFVAANGSSIAPAISADGEVISFSSNANNLVANDTNGVDDVFIETTP